MDIATLIVLILIIALAAAVILNRIPLVTALIALVFILIIAWLLGVAGGSIHRQV